MIALCLSGKRQWFSNLVKDDETFNPTGEMGVDQDKVLQRLYSLCSKEKKQQQLRQREGVTGGGTLKNIFEFEIAPKLKVQFVLKSYKREKKWVVSDISRTKAK